ncbi:MAG: DUF4910 domain-containing protein [Pseudomonadota bacterium]
MNIGLEIHSLAQRLWPICRSITGPGVRETLSILQEYLPDLTVHEVPTGTQCFDWTIPREWIIREAWITGPDGECIVDFHKNNLHVMGYSIPVDQVMTLEELQENLYSLPEQPDAIPYITSYYRERWGFCLTHRQRQALKPGNYRVKIDSELRQGSLSYGEVLLPGESEKEVFLSTYICHPSMANNELSGPCVSTFLARWLKEQPRRRYSYRIVFVPETIGSICYVSRHLETLRRNVIAGFVVTCVGDDRAYSFLPSRYGDTLSDRSARHVLSHLSPTYGQYSFSERGSDERQYCMPGVDLPMATIMRSKYGCYPEYHTSLDDLTLVTPTGLAGGFEALQRAIEIIEKNRTPRITVLCEPQLGKRGLYPTLGTRDAARQVQVISDLLAYADGTRSLLEISDYIKAPFWEIETLCSTLEQHELIRSSYDVPDNRKTTTC